jgi:hypothetical protein
MPPPQIKHNQKNMKSTKIVLYYAKIQRLKAQIKKQQQELALWSMLYLDKPVDRLFHASDATWWTRMDDTYLGKGALFRADPPEYVQKMAAKLQKMGR